MDYTFPPGILVGKEGKIPKKQREKGSFRREKSGKMPGFDWNFHGKKEGIERMESRNDWWEKKTWKKSKSIPSGREFWEPDSKGKQHFLFHLQQKSWKSRNSLIPRWILVGKWDFPGFYPTGRNFPGIPIPRKRRSGDARIFLGISGECWEIPEGWN